MSWSKRWWQLAAVALVATFVTACKSRTRPSEVKDLAANPNANNIMLLGWGRVLEQYKDWEPESNQKILSKVHVAFNELAANRGFDIREYHQLTKDEILKVTEEAARDVGADGTLVWYMVSHGSGGLLRSYDAQTVLTTELLAAFKKGRTFDGRVVPIRRLYVFLDYCNAAVTLDGLRDGVAPQPQAQVDLSQLPADQLQQETIASAFAQLGPAKNGEGLALNDVPEGSLVREGVLFSVANSEQHTKKATFYRALTETMAGLKGSPKLTVGEFLERLTQEVAKWPRDVFVDGQQKQVPQQAVYYAIPDDRILQEHFFDSVTKQWSVGPEPCPPWKGREWSYTHGRHPNGQCVEPAKFCSCLAYKGQGDKYECRIHAPGAAKGPLLVSRETDIGSSTTCYKSCRQLVGSNLAEFFGSCRNGLIVKNPIGRLELQKY